MSAERIDPRATPLPGHRHGVGPGRPPPSTWTRADAAGAPRTEARTFREGGSFVCAGVAGSGSVATCARCGGDLPLAQPFRRTVVLRPPLLLYSHLHGCRPVAPVA